jgi:hypothetical protein
MLTVMCFECRKSALYAECHYDECHYAKCCYADTRCTTAATEGHMAVFSTLYFLPNYEWTQ